MTPKAKQEHANFIKSKDERNLMGRWEHELYCGLKEKKMDY